MLVRSEKRPAPEQNDPHRYTDAYLLILVSLAGGPKHGHAIIKDVEALCGTRLAAGTVSDALARLAAAKYVSPLPAKGFQRPYEITFAGLFAVEAQLTTMISIVHAGWPRVEAKLDAPFSEPRTTTDSATTPE